MLRCPLSVLLVMLVTQPSHALVSEPPLTNTSGSVENTTLDTPQETLNNDEAPKNISGYYKGAWESQGIDPRFKHVLFLDEKRGDIMMDLHVGEPSSSGFCNIHGDVLLKNGLRLTDDDIRFTVEGMYLLETDHVTAVLKPKRHISIKVSQSEVAQNSPHYREALRREAARWTKHPAPLLKFGVPPELQFQPKHDCHFLMDFRVDPANSTETEDTDFTGPSIGTPEHRFRVCPSVDEDHL